MNKKLWKKARIAVKTAKKNYSKKETYLKSEGAKGYKNNVYFMDGSWWVGWVKPYTECKEGNEAIETLLWLWQKEDESK